MNLNKLPWWKTDYKSNKRMNCDFFEYLNNKEFLERLNKFPLTKYLTISFLDKHVSRINFIKLTTKKFEGSISRTDPWNSFNFEIMLFQEIYPQFLLYLFPLLICCPPAWTKDLG